VASIVNALHGARFDLPTVVMHEALLLLGPTGAGKTPLGELIEQRGLWGCAFAQFDFGAHLRVIAAQDPPDRWFSPAERTFFRDVIRSGALLEDAQFPLAQRILERFLAERRLTATTRILLNGLPRHAGQAAALEPILQVRWVVVLECTAETVLARIAHNVGGDRSGRTDDAPDAVRRKLLLFAERTAPLVEHYQRSGAAVVHLPVAADMTTAAMWQALDAAGEPGR
jgi:adenylate kinase